VEKRIFLTLRGLELRPLGRPARSQSLYRLRDEAIQECTWNKLIKPVLVLGKCSVRLPAQTPAILIYICLIFLSQVNSGVVPPSRYESLLLNTFQFIVRVTLALWPCRSSAVRSWLPTAAARVRVRAACGDCVGQSGTGAGFLRVLWFPLPIIPPISPLS
jgi:hypothetical protein